MKGALAVDRQVYAKMPIAPHSGDLLWFLQSPFSDLSVITPSEMPESSSNFFNLSKIYMLFFIKATPSHFIFRHCFKKNHWLNGPMAWV